MLDEAINEALPRLYVQALQENDLQPLAQPEIDITRLDDNETLEFTAEVDVRPEITLPDYDGLEVTVDDVAVTDQDVEEQLQGLRERFGTLSTSSAPPPRATSSTIDLKATKDGEVVEGGEAAGVSYQLGRGGMIEGLDEALDGMSAGDTKTFTQPARRRRPRGRGRRGRGQRRSASRSSSSPSSTTTSRRWPRSSTPSSELTDDLRVRLGNGKRLEQAAAARDAVLEKLLDLTEVPIPDAVVAEELIARRENVEQQLAFAGMTMEQYLDTEKQTVDEFEADLEKRVRDAVAAQFVLDEIAKKEELGVEQQELTEHMLRRAQQSGQNPNEYVKHMMEHNHIPELVSEVVRGKALALVVEQATVTDESGNHVELKNLRRDGTIGEPEDESAAEAAEDEAASRPSTGRRAEGDAERPDRRRRQRHRTEGASGHVPRGALACTSVH